MVVVIENEHVDKSSNLGQSCLHFILPLVKVWIQLFSF